MMLPMSNILPTLLTLAMNGAESAPLGPAGPI